MPEPLGGALTELRRSLLDLDRLVRAVAAGRRRGSQPALRRAELRPVDLRSGRHLQVVALDELRATTVNHPGGEPAALEAAVDDLLAQPFGNWHVETLDSVTQVRVTKKGEAQVHRSPTSRRDVQPPPAGGAGHDRTKRHLLDPGDPVFSVLGADADKRRQVDAFLRLLEPVVEQAVPADGRPLNVVDLGCGNAYLTVAAHRYLSERLGPQEVRTVGVDRRPDMVQRNTEVAARLGMAEGSSAGLSFMAGDIADARPLPEVDLVLALHACDTATDAALARAVRWRAPVTLAAPCCHHDLQRQLSGSPTPEPYAALTRHAILRERFADVLTDGLRALVLRLLGHRVDVVEFVDSRHTPRNALLRVVRTGAAPTPAQRKEYAALTRQWGVTPALASSLAPELAAVLATPAE